MKNTIKSLIAIVAVFTVFAFATIDKKEVKAKESKVVWKSYKVTGSHEGTINIKNGSLNFDNNSLVGGEFVMDMSTIAVTDLDGGGKKKLEGHLKSDDFFGVEKFTTSKLVFKKVKATGKNSYEVVGDITIKGKTEAITFDISVYGNKAHVTLKVDRTKFDIRYGSASFFDDLKNKAIYDEFDLVADLVF